MNIWERKLQAIFRKYPYETSSASLKFDVRFLQAIDNGECIYDIVKTKSDGSKHKIVALNLTEQQADQFMATRAVKSSIEFDESHCDSVIEFYQKAKRVVDGRGKFVCLDVINFPKIMALREPVWVG